MLKIAGIAVVSLLLLWPLALLQAQESKPSPQYLIEFVAPDEKQHRSLLVTPELLRKWPVCTATIGSLTYRISLAPSGKFQIFELWGEEVKRISAGVLSDYDYTIITAQPWFELKIMKMLAGWPYSRYLTGVKKAWPDGVEEFSCNARE